MTPVLMSMHERNAKLVLRTENHILSSDKTQRLNSNHDVLIFD